MKKLRNIIVLITALFLMTGCNDQQTEENNWTCLAPLETLAYPVLQEQDILPEIQRIPPPEPWEVVTLNSNEEFEDIVISNYLTSLATGNNRRIWILTMSGVLSYNSITGETVTYPYLPDNTGRHSSLIASSDGTIWLANPTGFLGENESNFLARYNQNEDRFTTILDNQHMLEGARERIKLIASDSQGNLWMMIHGREDQGIYRYDPTTNDTTLFPLPEEYASITSMAISPTDMVWFYDHLQNEIFVLDSTSGNIVEIIDMSIFLLATNPSPMDFNLDGSPYLYFDELGRLWIDDYGWFQMDQIPGEVDWYSIIRSPVFISQVGNYESSYAWFRPYYIMQSSDGMYWFSSLSGSVRLDPNTSQWCLFTTAENSVVEDADHTLWMFAYGALYRYQLEP